MAENTILKQEALPDLDDLLQCPVCYEIPSGHIYQCDQGHHVCGRCKVRLDECPVCRALFFGTRNYAMEELIANVRKLQAFKLGGKVTIDSNSSGSNIQSTEDGTTGESENNTVDSEDNNLENTNVPRANLRTPLACKGLFRCLCCKNGNGERLPSARLLNHLRYHHSSDLIEATSENGEYLQAWQFSTVPGRIVTAVRVIGMGIFFLIIEINNDSVHAWLSMAAAPWIAQEFSYTVTLSGRDREIIFSDCVWSVRSCEGSLKKRAHCLVVTDADARALIMASTINGKLSVRRNPSDHMSFQVPPRLVVRVANRGNHREDNTDWDSFFLSLQADVDLVTRQANELMRTGTEMRVRGENIRVSELENQVVEEPFVAPEPATESLLMTRSARRRLRNRLRAALDATQPEHNSTPPNGIAMLPLFEPFRQNGHVTENHVHVRGIQSTQQAQSTQPAQRAQTAQRTQTAQRAQPAQRIQAVQRAQPAQQTQPAQRAQPAQRTQAAQRPQPVPRAPPTLLDQSAQTVQQAQSVLAASGSSNGQLQNGNRVRVGKRKRRQRR